MILGIFASHYNQQLTIVPHKESRQNHGTITAGEIIVAAITKRGSSWVAQIFKRGVRKQASFSTKTEATAWATHTEAEIMAGKTGKTANKTLGDLLEKYRDEVSVRKKGERWEIIRINRLLDDPLTDIKLSDLKTPDFAKWRDKRRQEVSDATVRRELSQISTAISTAIRDWHWLTHHPMKGMTMPPVSKARDRLISQDEIDRLCAALGYTPGQRPVGIGAHTAVAMLFAIETAMRAGEICALRWTDIDLSHRVATIGGGKTDAAQRDVPMTTEAARLLELLDQDSELVFNLTSRQIDANFRRGKKLAGIEDLHFHDTRHTAITRLSKFLSVLELARAVGHRDLKMLMVYYNAKAKDLATLLP